MNVYAIKLIFVLKNNMYKKCIFFIGIFLLYYLKSASGNNLLVIFRKFY